MPENLHQLTPSQRALLREMLERGATAHAHGKIAAALRTFSPSLAGILERYGLIASRAAKDRPALYWLTSAGVGEARKPTETHHHG